MDSVVHIVDFWFWTLVPAIMLVAVLTGLPAAIILGFILTGRAPDVRR